MADSRLVLVATPLGNLQDLSERARAVLETADWWIVEDSRVSGKLAMALGLKKSMRRLDAHSTANQIEHLLEQVKESSLVALVTDAGVPCISDPGSLLVDLAYENDIEVDSIPGPSAVTTALSLSGFFAQRFAFLGYLGRKHGAMVQEFALFRESTLTIVLFESPFRVEALLKAAAEALPGRRFVACRELTKLHQQIYRGVLGHIPNEKDLPRKGEFTIVIEGFRRQSTKSNLPG